MTRLSAKVILIMQSFQVIKFFGFSGILILLSQHQKEALEVRLVLDAYQASLLGRQEAKLREPIFIITIIGVFSRLS